MLQRLSVSKRPLNSGLQCIVTLQSLGWLSKGKRYLIPDCLGDFRLDGLHRLAVAAVEELLGRCDARGLEIGIQHQLIQRLNGGWTMLLGKLLDIAGGLGSALLAAPNLLVTLLKSCARFRH